MVPFGQMQNNNSYNGYGDQILMKAMVIGLHLVKG